MTDATFTPADYAARILAAAERYAIAEYEQLAAEARERLAPATLIRDVFAPVLREAGDRWQQGEFSVVQEHMLTAALRRQLTYALDLHNRSATGPCLAFTTLSGERHELGSLMLAVLAASRGVRAIYLGPDLPVEEVGRFCSRVQVDAVAISVVTSPEVIDVPRQLRELRSMLPVRVPLWLGGRAIAWMQAAELPENCCFVTDLAEFERRLAGLPQQGNSA